MTHRTLHIGTRGSPLALWQAEHVRDLLKSGGFSGDIDVDVFSTAGDRIKDKPLREFGGKGLFTKEIDDALLTGAIDLAVHSMKDLPTELPAGTIIAAIPERGDVRDAFISHKARTLQDLPEGALVGTASLRRQAQVKRIRPDLRVETFRGNVQTRLRKLEEEKADATLLAYAGLTRLELTRHATAVIEPEEMLPAVGQGALGVACRSEDQEVIDWLKPLHHRPTEIAISCERAFLARLDGSCRTPIAGLAELDGDRITFRGMILKPDGSEWFETSREGEHIHAAALGTDAAAELLERAGPDFLVDLD
ncbi:Porphobilinogen deaminase [Methyloligella halotolerans]|uniref:Porphobilinogen deaminase n=1 Tax=Methyloligella halotolerans TaxID=1177755 RepID=A0A1E2S0T5_9HYPH|nr:hydroxymethylbilane synthase [Methyloligella halotolerans]ODA67935.1 Porphobilinogen deaminase [Methyloligella halotolerans]